ncbi:MAG: hypothetical protein EOM37_05220 [Proteobacteria bacterium]|jgi:hypothetical protein|nr:hypothetical protein [Alphaproteobacteria bacterium]NCC03433.1 hypothetical protein [Pseudomonadota bacterium]
MNKPNRKPLSFLSPDEIYAEAIRQDGETLSDADLKLIKAGLSALRAYRRKYLNAVETKAINALIAYVAYTQNVAERTVSSVVCSEFNCSDIAHISSEQYDQIISFLIDLKMTAVVN